jgi:hypothetical protein
MRVGRKSERWFRRGLAAATRSPETVSAGVPDAGIVSATSHNFEPFPGADSGKFGKVAEMISRQCIDYIELRK